MDLKVNRDMLSVKETVFDGAAEHSVELDYVLPDYCAEIFKLVKCIMTPKITSYKLNGDRLTYELSVYVKAMYYSENNPSLQCVNQKLTYSKTIELSRNCETATVCLKPLYDYINCRAVNPRRLDVRGAVTVKAKVYAEQKQEIVCDAFGLGTQLKKQSVPYAANRISISKQFSISETLELNSANPSVASVIRSDVVMIETDKKIISNKMVVKGEAHISLLYAFVKDGTSSLESMQFTLPYSQIVDMEGIDDSYECIAEYDAVSCEVTAAPGDDVRSLSCEIIVNMNCSAYRSSYIDVVSDAYSTLHPCEFAASNMRIDQMPIQLNDIHQTKTEVEYKDGTIDCVYRAWCNTGNINTSINAEDKTLTISGMLQYSVLIKNSDGFPVMIEKDEAFEHTFTVKEITEGSVAEPDVTVSSCSYNIVSGGAVAVKADIRIQGKLFTSAVCKVITDITVDESTKKQRDEQCAIKLYYGTENEDIWTIAKKYSSSIEAISEENDISGTKLNKNGMIIIPILN